MRFLKNLVIGMAYTRPDFKNKVEEKVGGAFFEYLKAEYAKANKKTRWVDHWMTEVKRLLDSELTVTLLHTCTFKNKRKAADEVILILKNNTKSYKSSAKRQLENNYFKQKLKNEIREDKINNFFSKVDKIIDDVLG